MPHSLLLVTGIYPPDSGGPAKFANEFSEWAVRNDCRVCVQTYAEISREVEDFPDVKVKRVSRKSRLLLRYITMIFSIGRNVERSSKILAVGAFLETYISSILFRFSYVTKVPGDIVWERARNNGKTQSEIVEFQGENIGLKYRIFRKLFTASLKKSDLVIVPSKGLFELCLGWGIPISKLRLVYNSVEMHNGPVAQRKSSSYDLITVCRLTPWKGVDELVEYAAKRDSSLVVVGDGPELANLKELVNQLGAKVIFLGNVSHSKVQEYLSKSKVFVLNSSYEGLPHALVEARSAGILAVGRAGTGSDEVIKDDVDGFLIRRDRCLEETLDLALSHQKDFSEFIERARIDSEARFNKLTNFPLILNLLIGNKK
jgi:glycosyltransferase involved in cell wall biosynthesis